MKFSALLVPLAVAIGVTALATPKRWDSWEGQCLSQSQADSIITQLPSLFIMV
jgi:hypothetical protein